MSESEHKKINFDETLIKSSRNFIKSCVSENLDYKRMKDLFATTFNNPTNLIYQYYMMKRLKMTIKTG